MTVLYKEYEVKIKMVQVQWLQPKIKFLVCYNRNFWLVRGGEGDSPHHPSPTCQHVWSLINFKRARNSHPHHNMACFLPLWSKVRILHLGHITDLPVISSMQSRVEKGPSLFQIILCNFLGSSNKPPSMWTCEMN